MSDVEQRLIKCFSAVFPELSPKQIVAATPNTNADWDSLTAVTLLAVIGEEFGVDLHSNGMGENCSFEDFLALVTEAVGNGIPVKPVH